MVLLLCLAVQRKPNEDVIARITTLRYKSQRDIMFFIEEALAKMMSHTLSSGLFTSGLQPSNVLRGSPCNQGRLLIILLGVGDMVPALSGRTSPETEEEVDEAMEEGQGEGAETDEIGGCGQQELVSTPQPRPSRIGKQSSCSGFFACSSSVSRLAGRHHLVTQNSASYYEGLESPAALRWMKKPIARRNGGGMSGSPGNTEEQPEEVLRLKHRVRVLEKSLLNEQTLSQEMHAALCQKEAELHEVEASLQKARAAAEKARELADVQDELQTAERALERSEKTVQRLQREAEEQRVGREQEMEQKTAENSRLESEIFQLKEVGICSREESPPSRCVSLQLLEKEVAEQLEQKSEVKRLLLSGETAAIAFQATQRECDSLLQLNQEVRLMKHTHTCTHLISVAVGYVVLS